MNRAVIIVAGGSGLRMGADLPKQFLPLSDIPILVRTVRAFHLFSPQMPVVLVLPEAHAEVWRTVASSFLLADRCRVVFGGEERFFSVKNGLRELADFEGIIAVHDGVRPLVTHALMAACFEGAVENGVAVPTVPVHDSLRQLTSGGSMILDRKNVRAVQTPQCFKSEILRKAYEMPFSPLFTDDASVVEACGYSISLVEGERTNIKITTQEDLLIAEAFLKK